MGTPVNPEQFAAHVREAGGGSVNPSTGESPKRGFMVSDYGSERIVPGHLEGHHVAEYLQEKSQHLAAPNAYLGAWHEEGQTYLDVSRNVDTKKKAMRAGRRNKQLAVYDVDNDAVHDVTGRRGKPRGY